MEIRIKTTDKEFEVANMLLSKAIEQVESKANLRKYFGITKSDVKAAARFRFNMLQGFLPDQSKQNASGSDTGNQHV